MEGLTRLVSESLARHGFDRPLDYRRLKWSRWFRCESHHSLLFVPSQPGVFALAEEVLNLSDPNREGHDFSRADKSNVGTAASAVQRSLSEAKGSALDSSRMLAVTQFFEADDMAFVLDRMLSHQNPMRARLASGRYFVRYVVIEDQTQRRSVTSALNQWIASSTEKATGIASHFATSMELTPSSEQVSEQTDVGTAASPALSVVEGSVQRSLREAKGSPASTLAGTRTSTTAPQPNSGAATNIHCPSPFPSGF